MRPPRGRVTVRRLMAAVAVVGLACGGELMRRRRDAYRARAAYHALQEAQARTAPVPLELIDPAEVWRREAEAQRRAEAEALRALDARRAARLPTTQQERREPWYRGMRAWEAEWESRRAARALAASRERAAYHRRMRLRFERAASRPWESVRVEDPPADLSDELSQEARPLDPVPPPP